MEVNSLNVSHTVRVGSSVNGIVGSCGRVSRRWWAVNGEEEVCKCEPGCCCSVGKSGGHLNIQPQGQRANSSPLNMPHKEKGSDKNGKGCIGKNLHFNVPVGIALDKSEQYERPHNPSGRRRTTCNSRRPENNILREKKL